MNLYENIQLPSNGIYMIIGGTLCSVSVDHFYTCNFSISDNYIDSIDYRYFIQKPTRCSMNSGGGNITIAVLETYRDIDFTFNMYNYNPNNAYNIFWEVCVIKL